jgi:hypothetical protein
MTSKFYKEPVENYDQVIEFLSGKFGAAEYCDVSTNFCKLSTCANFGVVPTRIVNGWDQGVGVYRRSDGGLFNGSTKTKTESLEASPTLECSLCRLVVDVVNDDAVARLMDRYWRKFDEPFARVEEVPGCPNRRCANYLHPVVGSPDSAKCYRRYGKTAAGTTRFQCKECNRVISGINPRSTKFQKRTDLNRQIFHDLVTTNSIRSCFGQYHTGANPVYYRLDFLYRQCLAFTAFHERKFAHPPKDRPWKLKLSTDRQFLTVNWKREGKNSTRFNHIVHAITTVDNASGFVLAVHTDYDEEADQRKGFAEIKADEDAGRRRYARRLAAYESRRDFLSIPVEERPKYPSKGLMVDAGYFHLAHFFYLKRLLGSAIGDVAFYMDNDLGLAPAMVAAFHKEIAAGTVDGFNQTRVTRERKSTRKEGAVRIGDAWDNGLPYEKAKAHRKRDEAEFRKLEKAAPPLEDPENLRLQVIANRLDEVSQNPAFKYMTARWVWLPNSDGIKNALVFASPFTFKGKDQVAVTAPRLKACSIQGVDTFFSAVRMKLKPFIRTPKSHHPFGLYDPGKVIKYLEIFRTVYNFVLTDNGLSKLEKKAKAEKKRKPRKSFPEFATTRAMRLGLCDRAYELEDIIDFMPPQGVLMHMDEPTVVGAIAMNDHKMFPPKRVVKIPSWVT